VIKEVYIKNFKSITDAKVKLDDFSIVVGRNGAGKSNFIQAVAFLRDIIVGEEVRNSAKKWTYSPREIFNRNGTSLECQIGALVTNGDENQYEFFVTVSSVENKSGVPRLVIKNEPLHVIEPSGKRKLIFEREGTEIYDSERNLVPIEADLDTTAISLYKNPYAGKVRKLFKSTHLPINDIVSSVQINDTTPIADKVANLIIRLKKANDGRYEKFLKFSKQLIPALTSFVDIDINFDENQLVLSEDREATEDYLVLFEEENLRGRLSMKAISHGDIKTLYYMAAATYSEPGTVFFFEEIENGMHPERVANIVGYLQRISYKEEKQFVFTTHSTTVINCVSPKNVIYVKKDNHGSVLVGLSESGEIGKIERVLNSGADLNEIIESKV
jgi:predicted ATPase